MQELLSDYVFPKIEKDKIQEMFDTAWSIGEQAADAFIGQWGQDDRVPMREVLQRSGVKIIEKDIDYVVGKRRYFCEFFSGIGGGAAGFGAAVASARNGADTLLIEKSEMLGGMATAGLVGPFMTCYDDDG